MLALTFCHGTLCEHMEYGAIEAMLADLHGIAPNELKAFRARIRVLRDVGVPAVHKPGKGSKVDYDFVDFWETHVALTLERFGLTPLRVKFVTAGARIGWIAALKHWEAETDSEVWACIVSSHNKDQTQKNRLPIHRLRGGYKGTYPDDGYSEGVVVEKDKRSKMFVRISTLAECVKFLRQAELKSEPARLYALLNLSQLNSECQSAIRNSSKAVSALHNQLRK